MDCKSFVAALAIAYLPGIVLGTLIWLVAKRREAMPLFRSDLIGLFLPLIVWFIMHRYNWSFVRAPHNGACELQLLGWIWGAAFILRLLIPRFTHKLRFRLASVYAGGIALAAAVVLALFFK